MEVLLFCKEYPDDSLTKALILRNNYELGEDLTEEEKEVFKVIASFVIRHMRKCALTVGTSLHRIMKAYKTHCFIEGIHTTTVSKEAFHNYLLRLGLYAKLKEPKKTIYFGFLVCEEYDFYCK